MNVNMRILLVILFSLILLPKYLFGYEYPPYVAYKVTVTISGSVTNIDDKSYNTFSQIVTGAQITVRVDYFQYDHETGNMDSKYETQVVYTAGDGKYYTWFDLLEINPNAIQVTAQFSGPSTWLLYDEKSLRYITTTDFTKDFEVIPFIDADGNGIRDDFEFALAKKFAPEMQPNRDPCALFPEPVEIMGGTNNSEIYITVADDKDRKWGPHRVDLVQRYHYNEDYWENLMPSDFEFGQLFNYSKRFQMNPIHYDSLMIRWKSYKEQAWSEAKVEVFENKKLWYHLLWSEKDSESSWWLKYNEERLFHLGLNTGNSGRIKYAHTIYAVVWNDLSIDKPVVQYWFFYPYNDFANDHEGDWEHINVIINNQIPEKAEIESIQYYFHAKWTEIKRSTIEFADDSLHHPMVYIGGSGSGGNKAGSRYGDNSNSSYPYGYRVYYKIEHLRRIIIWDFDQDETVWSTSRGRVPYSSFTSNSDEPNDYRGLELLKDPSFFQSINFYYNHEKYSWFNTDIRFGIPKSEVISQTIGEHRPIESKHGPAQNQGWKIVGSSSGFAPWEGWHEPIRLPH